MLPLIKIINPLFLRTGFVLFGRQVYLVNKATLKILIVFLSPTWWWLEIRRYSPHQLTARSPEKMAKEGYRISFLDNKSSGSSPEKDLIQKPDTYQLTHDASLGKRLDVGDSSQIHPYQLLSDVGLENYDSHYSQNLSFHGSIGKRPQRNKNCREYNTKPSNNMKATTSHSCGDLLTSLSNPDSSTGRLLKLSSGNSFLSVCRPLFFNRCKDWSLTAYFGINISYIGEFPVSPMVRILCFHCWGCGFSSWLGN